MKVERRLYRILDANFNRAKEGLRVCEDICRYAWDQKTLTRGFKDLRQALTETIRPLGMPGILAARDIGKDVGKATSTLESSRRDLAAVFSANCQRVKESLRVLEEILKLIDPAAAQRVKSLRYRSYALEQKSLKIR